MWHIMAACIDGKITNEARKFISEYVCNHMYELRDERLRSIFDTDDKGSYTTLGSVIWPN